MSNVMGHNARPHPRWSLGNVPELLRNYDDKKIESEEDLDNFVAESEADLCYGSKILLTIDRLREEAGVHGVTKDMMGEVERQTGSLVPVGESTKRCLTSLPSKTGQRELIVALESSGKYGKAALLLIMIAALLKIVGWLINNGSAYSGPAAATGEDYAKKVGEMDTSALPDDSVIEHIEVAVLREAYNKIYPNVDKSERVKFNASITHLDGIIMRAKANEYLNDLAAALNHNPLEKVIQGCADGDHASLLDVVKATVSALLGTRVTSGIFQKAPAQRAWGRMPRDFQVAGIQIPEENAFGTYVAGFGSLTDVIADFAQAFNKLKAVDLKKVADPESHGTTPSGNVVNDAIGTSAQFFARNTVRFINDVVATCVFSPRNGRFDGSTMPVLVLGDNFLAGYEVGYEIPGTGGRSLYVAQSAAYLSLETIEAMEQKGTSVTADNATALLGAIAELGPKSLSKSNRNTDLSGYTKLHDQLEKLRNEIDAWGKTVRDTSSEALEQLNTIIAQEIKREGGLGSGDVLGFTNIIFQPNPSHGEGLDFYASVGMVLQMTKTICRGGATLQGIIDKTKNNPFVIK